MSEKMSIKQWAVEDRPREKMIQKGLAALTDAELLAIIIGSGTKKETAVELSRRILSEAGNNISMLGKMSVTDFVSKFKGIGQAKAVSIVAALELGKRRKMQDISQLDKITSSRDVFDMFHPILVDLPYEEFWVLYLNRSNKVLEKRRISQGGITGTVIDPRIIFKAGVELRASGVILCHNHPSGNLKPSDQDIAITRKLKQGGEVLDISVLDHLIVTESGYYSMSDEGIV
jgi:DNA repair protein RadC